MSNILSPIAKLIESRIVPSHVDPDSGLAVELNGFSWTDDTGAAYDRSNVRSLARDYPQYLSISELPYSGEVLMLDLDAFTSATDDDDERDAREYLANVLVGVTECYSIYDESDLSELEAELQTEAWDGYLASDVVKAFEAAYDIDLSTLSFDADLFGIWAQAHNDANPNGDIGYAESATTYVFRDPTSDDVMACMLDGIAAAYLAERPAVCEGQTTLI